jgi:uncharacterized membrane protein YfhO
VKQYKVNDTLALSKFTYPMLDSLRKDLMKDTLVIQFFSETKISGKIDMSQTGILYLSIPRDKAWKISVDGKKRAPILLFNGMTGILIEKGEHEVEMFYQHRFLGTGVSLSMAGMVLVLAIFLVGRIRRKPEEEDFLSDEE